MTSHKISFLKLLAILSISKTSVAAADTQTFELKPGAVISLEIPESSRVDIKPTGVIKIEKDLQGQWNAKGLAKGVATAEMTDLNTGELKRRLQFRVGPAQVQRVTPSIHRGVFPVELCTQAGVICRPDEGVISGVTDSYQWRNHARQLCKQTKVCHVDTKLSDQGIRVMLEDFRDLLQNRYEIYTSSRGDLLIGIECNSESRSFVREQIDFITAGGVERGDVGLECRRPSAFHRFSVKFRITAITDSTAGELGIGAAPHGFISVALENNHFSRIPGRIRDLLSTNAAKSLGEPSLVVDFGRKAKLSNGSEIISGTEFDRQTGETRPFYKNIGLDVEVEVIDLEEGFARLKIVARLKSQSRHGQGKLSNNELVTEVSAKLGEDFVLGSSELLADDKLETSSSILSHIPIVGPLFKLSSVDSSKTIVVVSMLVNRLHE